MDIIVEAQWLCSDFLGGVGNYLVSLLENLTIHTNNRYGVTFFDYNRERNNRRFIDKYLSGVNVDKYECNSLDYREIMSREDVFNGITYEATTQTKGDVYFFPCHVTIPHRMVSPTVVTVHDMIPAIFDDFPPADNPFRMQFFKNIKRMEQVMPYIITDSVSTQNDLLNYAPQYDGRVFPVLLGVDHDVYRPCRDEAVLRNFGIAGEYILFVGAIDIRKNIIGMIRAFECLNRKDVQLVLAGGCGNAFNEIMAEIEQSPVRDRIIVTGYISLDEKIALYSSAALFLYPTFYEGFGLPLLEALACGCPAITSQISSLPEIGGDTVIYVNPNDTEQVTAEIRRVLDSNSLRHTMSQDGQLRASGFTWKKTAENAGKIFELAYRNK